MRGFMKRIDEWNDTYEDWLDRHVMQITASVIAGMVLLLIALPIFVMWDASRTAVQLMAAVKNLEFKFEQDREAQRQFNKTTDIRLKSLSDEQKFIREQPSRSFQRTRTEWFTVTAYTLHPSECGKAVGSPGYGVTASGRKLTEADAYKVVAVDNRYIKFGTRMIIHAPQGDLHVVAADTGGDIQGNRIDLFVSEADRREAFKWGVKQLKVTILQ